MDNTIENDVSTDTQPYIAGFWRRSFAFIIDALLIGAFCNIISSLLGKFPYEYPILITLIGYLFVILYFTYCNSVNNNGQTIGKILQSIKVVKLDQQYLSLSASFLRSAILYAPFCLMSFTLLFHPVLNSIFTILLGSLLISIIYLYIFNRKNRRSIHDYLAHTIVIKNGVEPKTISTTWNVHFYIATILVFIFSGLQVWNSITNDQDYIPISLQNLKFKELSQFDYGYLILPKNEEGINPTQHYYLATITDPNLLNNPSYAEEFAQYIFKLEPRHRAKYLENYVQLTARYQFGLISKKRSSTYLIETDDQQKITAQEVSSQQQTQIGGGY